MKKYSINKILILVICAFCAFFVSEVKAIVESDFPNSITLSINGQVNDNGDILSGASSELPAFFTYKYFNYQNKNYIIFCASDRKVDAVVGAYTLNDNWNFKTRVGVGTIIKNGVGINATTATHLKNNADLYLTQIAIWRYLEDSGVFQNDLDYTESSINANSNYKEYYDNLLEEAKSEEKRVSETLNLSLTNDKLVFTKSGDYYVSNAIKLRGTNLDSTSITSVVSGAVGVMVTGDNTNGYIVKVPALSLSIGKNSIEVKFTAKSNKYYLASRYIKDGSGQDLTTAIEKSNSEEITITGSIGINSAAIKKVDEKGNYLSGAHLQVEDESGSVLYEFQSTEEDYIIYGLAAGTYYLVETSAPEGYLLNTERVKFVIVDGESAINVEMKNELIISVPDTLSSRSSLILAIAMFDIAFGVGIFVYAKKNKIEQ